MNQRAASVQIEDADGFVPDEHTSQAYRHALGRFSTGVTIVTTLTSAGPIGMTVNSFASVSLTPPLVLWSVSKSSGCGIVFERAERFTINVLNHSHGTLAYQFASQADGFTPDLWRRGEDGIPLLNEALARFECQAVARHDGGDHTILIGQVDRAYAGEGSPLVFYKGGFGDFQSPSA